MAGPLYREFWANIDLAPIVGVADLPRLPIVTRQIYRESGHEYWLSADQEVETIIHSTGTTGDLTCRSYGAKDRDTVAEIHRQVNRRIADRAADAALPLRMSVGAASHWAAWTGPGTG